MRVAIATWFPRDPDKPHGGVEAVSVNLVRALAKRGDLEIHVVTFDRCVRTLEVHLLDPTTLKPIAPAPSSQLPAPGCGLQAPCPTPYVALHLLPASYSSLLPFAIGPGRRMLQTYLTGLRPDVVHAHDTYGLMIKGWPGPRVFTIHGFIHEDTLYGNGRLRRLRAWLWRRFETAAWADQPHIVSISPYVRERLRGIARGMIYDIENPIAPECFEVQRAEVPGTIFSAGAICSRKNTLGLIQAFARVAQTVPEARLRVAGKAEDPAYEKQVKQLISANGLIGQITLLGPLSPGEVRQELAQASVFALVSFEEGAPMSIAEAMAAGVPVVTSNRCGMPYMVRDGESGFLVSPQNPEEIADRLRELLTDKALRQRMGLAARAFALDRFHPDRVAERTATVYRLAMGSQAALTTREPKPESGAAQKVLSRQPR